MILVNDVKQTKQPEELTLEELEELGVELTDWERKVADNPRFQQLRRTSLPRWGELATGVRRVQSASEGHPSGTKYVDTENGPLAPSQWRKQFDKWHQEKGPAVRSLGILAAELARDHPTQGPDWLLLQNLSAFLDRDSSFYRFRWEKQAAENIEARKKAIQEKDRWQKIVQLQQGQAEVIVIPLNGVPPRYIRRWRDMLRQTIKDLCQASSGMPGKAAPVMPYVRCEFCDSYQPSGSHDCGFERAFVFIDCREEVLARLPKRLQKRQVSFRVPRNTFEPSLDQIHPQMWLFLLDGLRSPTRNQFIQQLESHIIEVNREAGHSEGLTQNVLVRPADGSSRAVLISSPLSHWAMTIEPALRIQLTTPTLQKVLGPNTPISVSSVRA